MSTHRELVSVADRRLEEIKQKFAELCKLLGGTLHEERQNRSILLTCSISEGADIEFGIEKANGKYILKVGLLGSDIHRLAVETDIADLTADGCIYSAARLSRELELVSGVTTAREIKLRLSLDLKHGELEVKSL